MSQDLYELLGVARDADADTIKKAYRRLARQLPPRRQPGPGDPGAVQGGHPRLRGALGPAEAGGVRPRRRPVRRRGGFGQGAGFSFTDIMDAFFGGQAGAGPDAAGRGRAYAAARTR